jgi:hypothetical protein
MAHLRSRPNVSSMLEQQTFLTDRQFLHVTPRGHPVLFWDLPAVALQLKSIAGLQEQGQPETLAA